MFLYISYIPRGTDSAVAGANGSCPTMRASVSMMTNVQENCYLHCGFYLKFYWYLNDYYSTGVQIVSCTLSDDSVLSESTGLFNPVLCVSQWNLFWQKNQPMRLCLSNQVRSAREWFPSPLGDFIRLFEGLIGELFQIWHWNMFYFFKWHQSGP